MFGRIRKSQHTAENLLDIHARRFIGQRCQNVGERTVPALFQCIDRNDVTHRTVAGQQVGVFDFVLARRLDFYLLFGNPDVGQLLLYLVERNVVVGRFGWA